MTASMIDTLSYVSLRGMPLNLAYPLDTFYVPAGRPLPRITQVEAANVPQPFHRLLVGAHDMTPTLEAYHGARVGIHLLERVLDGDRYSRLVVLSLPDGTPIEFGAIMIYLDCLPLHSRQLVTEGKTPFGTVLAMDCVGHSSCPQAFVRVEADPLMQESLRIATNTPLYGRRNILLTDKRRVLADILEILPPAPERA